VTDQFLAGAASQLLAGAASLPAKVAGKGARSHLFEPDGVMNIPAK